METTREKLARFEQSLARLVDRLGADRNILAIVLVGSLSESTIWMRETLNVWIVEADGVSLRLRSDGNEERIYRILVEDGINIHAEIIPRSRFKQMVEGASRTAFSCSFFAERRVVSSADPSISQWFEQANSIAIKDQERELLTFTTWTIHALRHARKLLLRPDELLAAQQVLNAAHSVAYTEVIRAGQVWEHEPIHRALELNPSLFHAIYTAVLADLSNRQVLLQSCEAMENYLVQNYPQHLKPLIAFLRQADCLVPLSLISDHFAYSQVFPWHLESTLEWLEQQGIVQKLSAPFKLTKRSQEQAEEPAYQWERTSSHAIHH